MEGETQSALETIARDSYSRLLAYVATRAGGDVASAEDALADSFLAALRQWPGDGVPDNPSAWLLATARRRLIDAQRRGKTRTGAVPALTHALEAAQEEIDADHGFPDERLKLLFICAHPAIDAASRTPLMLQMVLGLEAGRIASAFLTSPLAMSQRLVRAKAKIREARIPFIVPPRQDWPERLGYVIKSIYAAYTIGWDVLDEATNGLAVEAIWLARVLVYLLPDEPEVLGLLSLLLHSHARRPARVISGHYVPLTEQNTSLWDESLIQEAEELLRKAAQHQSPGRFQLEAAIQSIHAQRLHSGETLWPAVAMMYGALVQHTQAYGARIGRAIAVAKVHGADAGLSLLDAMPQAAMLSHQPYWAARAQLLADDGRKHEALDAFEKAIGLSEDSMVRDFLSERKSLLLADQP